MIKLIVTDLDGCVSHPFLPPNWETISRIKELNEASEFDSSIPPLTICTGRPYPYAEAVAQWLNVRHFILFESGVGVYHPKQNDLLWSDLITPSIQAYFDELRTWTIEHVVPQFPKTLIEFTKKLDVGLVSPHTSDIMKMYSIMKKKTEPNQDWVEVHNTDVSVNVIYKQCNKGTGLHWLSSLLNIPVSEMAYIGDGMNDAPALIQAGIGFAPENARPEAKESADIVLSSDSTLAVLEAYEYCINLNKLNSIATI